MTTALRAGAARVEITPPIGVDLTGFIARENPCTGVRDPLYARALVVDDGSRRLAMLSCDLLGLARDLVDQLRDHISQATGIPGPQILIATTHTHAGPAALPLIDCGEIAPAYVEGLLPKLVAAVEQAQAALRPATAQRGSGASTAGVHNRRSPGDVIDSEVGVLRLDDAQGDPIALVVNYTCHPTTLHFDNRLISADYPGLICQQLEADTGAVALYLMGAIGDVGPVTRGEESLALIGQAVTAAVRGLLPKLTSVAAPRLDTEGELLALPLFPLPTREQWAAWREEYTSAALAAERDRELSRAKVQWAMVHWTERMFEAMQANQLQPTVPAEVQMLRIGDLVIIGVPGEYFVELGLQIKAGILAAGTAAQVMICGFANGNIGYIPARRAYPIGGYEVAEAYKYYSYPAAVTPDAGEQIVAQAIALAARAAKPLPG